MHNVGSMMHNAGRTALNKKNRLERNANIICNQDCLNFKKGVTKKMQKILPPKKSTIKRELACCMHK